MPRRTARYLENADVRGRVREARFDIPAEAPAYQPSAHEAAEAAYKLLGQSEQDELTGWLVSNVSKAVPRAPWDGGPKTGLLGAATLAQEAAQDLGQDITPAQMAGAALSLEFEAVTDGPSPSAMRICAVYKDS